MSQDTRPRGADGANPRDSAPGVDRLELHYRQQLSALVDGALAPDEARFLLRRLEHDQDLADGYERWQLYGQAMRGELGRLAAPDFAGRVAVALGEAPLQAGGTDAGTRRGWVRWGGGGAALAASVAVVALFMGQAQDPALQPGQPAPVVAASPAMPAVASPAQDAAPAAEAPARFLATAEPAATASVAAPRPSVRPQPVVREPLRAVASVREVVAPAAPAAATPGPVAVAMAPVAAAATAQDPFASVAPLAARPWPRAALPQPSGGAFTASFGASQVPAGSRPFYPFEPALAPVEGDATDTGAAQASPPPAAEEPPR